MEFRRESLDGELVTPGSWAGPFPSGAPAIFASVAARLRAPTALAAGVGDDAFGGALIERLRRDGVDDEGVVIGPGRATAVALVAYRRSGKRDFWFSVCDSAAMDLDVAAAERLAERADWLHVSGVDAGIRRRSGARDRGRRRPRSRARRPAVARPQRAQRGGAPARDRGAAGALGARPVPLRGRARGAEPRSARTRGPRRPGLRDPRTGRCTALRRRRARASGRGAGGRGRSDRRGRHVCRGVRRRAASGRRRARGGAVRMRDGGALSRRARGDGGGCGAALP